MALLLTVASNIIYIKVIFKTNGIARKVSFSALLISRVLYIKYIILQALGKSLRTLELPPHTSLK